MKITYIVPDFDENAYSGGLYVIFEHCNGLIERGHDVRLFNHTGKKSKYLPLKCQVEVHHNNPDIIESNSPDIIVGTYWHTYFFINRMRNIVKNNTKLCFLVQNNDRFIYGPEDVGFIQNVMTTKYHENIPINKIVVSQYLKDVLRDDFGEDSYYVKNGFEPHDVAPLLPKSGKLRIAARYDPSGFRGWDTVNKVLRKIARARDDIEIHLFEMKNKRPPGYKNYFHKGLSGDRLLSLFKSCDIYLSGSRYEGFSYPIIEAMSQGACVCCTDAGGNREFCINNDTALMSPMDDADSLYGNLLRLLDDPGLMERLRRRGIDKSKEFRWKDAIDSLEKCFVSIASQKYEIEAAAKPATIDKKSLKTGKVLFVYARDPFGSYEEWSKVEGSMKRLERLGLDATCMLLVDRHPIKSVRARLSVFLTPEEASKFKYKIFYSKKLKLRLPLLPRPIFASCVVAELLSGIISGKRPYSYLSWYGSKGPLLKLLCKILKIDYLDGV